MSCAMVSTLTEECFLSLFKPLGTQTSKRYLWLRITSASGIEIPYIGYIETDIECERTNILQMGSLVVKD